jgi:DNA-binding XRE family transcriptional regulator
MKAKRHLNHIKKILGEQGRSQTWLAKKLELAFPTVNSWCNNKSQPTLTHLVEIAELLDVAPVELIVDGAKKEKGLRLAQTFN